MSRIVAAFLSIFAWGLLVSAHADQSAGESEAHAKLIDLFGEVGAQSYAEILPADHQFDFEIYTPAAYDPAKPAGVFVFVSPTVMGEIPDTWRDVFDNNNMIWISVKASGNKRPALRRVVESLASVVYAQNNYAVDPARFYIGGFSGGGRITSYVSMFYPDVFTGSVYISGVNSFKDEPNAMLDEMKKNRFVFMAGSEDFNRRETEKIFKEYKKAGFENISLMIIQSMGHSIPDAGKLQNVFDYLEGNTASQ